MQTELGQWRLGLTHTPSHAMPLLADMLDIGTLTIKREDLSGVGAGGGAARKLRFLLHDAFWNGADALISHGTTQSSSCAQLCAAAGGASVELFLAGIPSITPAGNYLAMSRSTAKLRVADVTVDEAGRRAARRAVELQAAGRRPFVIPFGATAPLSVAGCSEIVEELQSDGIVPDVVYVAASSLGMLASLVIGSWRQGAPWNVEGVCVRSTAEESRTQLRALLDETRALYFPHVEPRENYRLRDDCLGAGPGHATAASRKVAGEVAAYEGVYLDDAFAAKAFSAIFRDALDGKLRGKHVLFVHAGGVGNYFSPNAGNAVVMP